MIYLASPYSHPDPAVREGRFHAACQATAQLIRAGHQVFSPIVHGHPLACLGLPTDWGFWQRFDEEHLKRCDELLVLQIDGWRESEGVRVEIALAAALGMRIDYLPAENDGVSLSSSARTTSHPWPTWREVPRLAPVGGFPASHQRCPSYATTQPTTGGPASA